METAKEMHEGSGSKSEDIVIFRDFLFQKTYAEEMLMCLHAFQFEKCYACQSMGYEHTCKTLNIFQYWNEAQHYFSRSELMYRLNVRCQRYFEQPFTLPELAQTLPKVFAEWLSQIRTMILILDEKM